MMKKISVIVLISIFVLIMSGCTSTQSYGGDAYSPLTFETTMADTGAANGGAPGVMTVAWNVIKWPIQFIFGIPKATLGAFDNMFQSADAAGVGQVVVTEGY